MRLCLEGAAVTVDGLVGCIPDGVWRHFRNPPMWRCPGSSRGSRVASWASMFFHMVKMISCCVCE
jgi:hypothetical protein